MESPSHIGGFPNNGRDFGSTHWKLYYKKSN